MSKATLWLNLTGPELQTVCIITTITEMKRIPSRIMPNLDWHYLLHVILLLKNILQTVEETVEKSYGWILISQQLFAE